jgi:hypothetical protein
MSRLSLKQDRKSIEILGWIRIAMSKAVGAFLWFFILFWSSITLLLDRQMFLGMFQQLATLSYHETQGQVLQSDVKTHDTDEGSNTFSLEVSFHYQVSGKEYVSNRYRFGSLSASDSFAHQMSEQLSEQPAVPVYFNPAKPSEAVLVKGLEGIDLFCILFLTPFNMVMLVGWWGICIWLSRLYKKPEAGGVKFIEQDHRTISKLHYKSPVTIAIVVLGACSFLGVFIVAFPFGFHPSLMLMEFVWAVIIGLAAYAVYSTWKKNQSGMYDLIIDDSRQTISFCPMHVNLDNVTLKDVWKAGKFSARVSLHRSQIQNIFIESKTTTDSDGDSKTNYFPTIKWQQEAVLMMTTDKEQAEEFVAWLRRRIGIAAKAV